MDRALFGTTATLDLFYIVLEGKSGISKNKDAPLWNFVPNSGKFRNCKLTVTGVVNLGGRSV